MNKQKYIKWYRLAEEVINDTSLVPNRTGQQIEDFVSQEDWLMFSPESISSKNEGKDASIPNVWFDLYEEDSKTMGRIGLAFNTILAVEKIKNILSGFCHEEKEKIIKKLLNLEGIWKITVNRKIRDNYLIKPKYEIVFEKKSNEIDASIIDEIIRTSEKIRKEGKERREKIKYEKKSYTETPTIDLMVCDFELSESEFEKRIKEAFDVLKICLNVKTDSQIKKLEKQTKITKEQLEDEIKRLEGLKMIYKNDAKIDSRIKELESEIKGIKREMIL